MTLRIALVESTHPNVNPGNEGERTSANAHACHSDYASHSTFQGDQLSICFPL